MSDENLLKTSEKCKSWLNKLLGDNSSVSPFFRAALDEIRAQVRNLFEDVAQSLSVKVGEIDGVD